MPWNSFIRYSVKVAVIIAAGSLLSGCAAKSPLKGTDWAAYLRDDSRTNVSRDTLSLPLVVSWNKDVSDFKVFRTFPKEQLSSPVIAGGLLYAGSTNESFYALDLASGKAVWRFDSDYPLEAPPAVADGLICFGSGDGILRCFDSARKPLWQFQARSEILSSPVIRDGKVFFNSSDDRAYALDARTGEKVWTYTRGTYKTVTPRIYGSPAYSEALKRLYYFFSDGSVVCLSAETGKEVWTKKTVKDFDTAKQIRRTPLVDGGIVYIIDGNDAVLALSEGTGETKGIYNLIKARDFIVPDKRTLIIAGVDQAIAIDRLSGAILWKTTQLARSPVTGIFASGEHLFLVSNYRYEPLGIDFLAKTKGHIEALRLKDGSSAWSSELKSDISANGAAGSSRVALHTNSGVIQVFEPK